MVAMQGLQLVLRIREDTVSNLGLENVILAEFSALIFFRVSD
jgi:hypothetical protein